MGPQSKNDLLWKIHEDLIRTDERLKALGDANELTHKQLSQECKNLSTTLKEMDNRIKMLEEEKVKIGILWKALTVLIPLTITVLYEIFKFLLHF